MGEIPTTRTPGQTWTDQELTRPLLLPLHLSSRSLTTPQHKPWSNTWQHRKIISRSKYRTIRTEGQDMENEIQFLQIFSVIFNYLICATLYFTKTSIIHV